MPKGILERLSEGFVLGYGVCVTCLRVASHVREMARALGKVTSEER